MRATFHVSLYDVGTARIRWGEALELFAAASLDTSTYLAVAQHRLRYPADMVDIVTATAVLGLAGVENAAELLPFGGRDEQAAPPPKPDEFKASTVDMLAAWGIADPNIDSAVARQVEIYENRKR